VSARAGLIRLRHGNDTEAGRWLHQVLMGGGIAAAVTGALLTWWLSSPPSIRAKCGVATGGNITVGRDLRTECPPATSGRD
jgi:hypothetical protein